MIKRILLIISLLFFTGFITVAGAYWYFKTFQPDTKLYPILGIDVSHHQGRIDWKRVAKHNVHFAYIKSTEGGDWKDRLFKTNWKEANDAGIIRGAYHFFTFCRPGLDQAQNFIDTVPVVKNSLPPALDLEFGGNCSKTPNTEKLMQDIQIFLEKVEKHYKKKPVLYVTPEFYNAYSDEKILKTYPLWVRSIIFKPRYVQSKWHFWQFHNRGQRNGISGPVDLNVFQGNKAALIKFTSPIETSSQ